MKAGYILVKFIAGPIRRNKQAFRLTLADNFVLSFHLTTMSLDNGRKAK